MTAPRESHEKLVLGQEAVDAKSNELTAIPALLERLAVSGALADADEAAVDRHTDVDKGHGRIEERRYRVSAAIDWMEGERHFPGEYRFPKLAAIAMIESKAETKAGTRTERRFYISSRAMTAKVLGEAVRAHWQIENALHWVLDVTFKDDLSRVRKGHGAENMAVIRHFAVNLLRAVPDKKSLKLRRKIAGWNPDYLQSLIQKSTVNLDS